MLGGADHTRDASWKFRPGTVSAPEADVAREEMRKRELAKLEGKEAKKTRSRFEGKKAENWRELHKKMEVKRPQKVMMEEYGSIKEKDEIGEARETAAEKMDKKSGKMSQEDWRRMGKMEKESRRPFGRTYIQGTSQGRHGSGERPRQTPEYKTEKIKMLPPRKERDDRLAA